MATKIIIDGYNFLWNSAFFRKISKSSFEAGREAVIDWLASQPFLGVFDVAVVFDAHHTDQSSPSNDMIRGIEVIYTASGQKADDLIRYLASEYTSGAIIVSSDIEIMRHAEKKGCGILGAREFQVAIEQPEIFELRSGKRHAKGKQRALSRILGKLS